MPPAAWVRLDPSPAPSADPVDDLLRTLPFHPPHWLVWAVALLITVGGIATAMKPLYGVFSWLGKTLLGAWRRRHQDERAARQRGLFADHLESQLRRMSEKEDWRDSRFAELEAEVEIEGEQRHWWSWRNRQTLRRVKSLSRALERSTERLIVLEGEPGSGKSVAMRHVAQRMAKRAADKLDLRGIIPLYINLRELQPIDGEINGDVIRRFVLATLNRANNRDVDRYLDDEFDKGMREGTWLFLFDSFDEIPEVLSSTEYDTVVERYADALYDFLHTLNRSRGVVASREFRGPRRFGWPRFKIMRLTQKQKLDLVSRADLTSPQEELVIGGLATADAEVAQLADNPMLLGLLCEHVRDTGRFPASSHVVFEAYVAGRVERDADMIRTRFALEPAALRLVAEEVAFLMATGADGGLSPSRRELNSSEHLRALSGGRLDRYLDALEYIKLARAPEPASIPEEAPFAFAHRRFQEYFATCVVLRDTSRVPIASLLTDFRWRETAVAILQTQTAVGIRTMLDEAEAILDGLLPPSEPGTPDDEPPAWPPGSLHLLELLSVGLVGHWSDLSLPIRTRIGALLLAFWEADSRLDRKWALAVVFLAPDEVSHLMLEEAFDASSALLRELAYRQAGALRTLPVSLEIGVARTLIALSATRQLSRDRVAVRAQLRRLTHPERLLQSMALLIAAPWIDLGLLSVLFGVRVMNAQYAGDVAVAFMICAVTHAMFYLYRLLHAQIVLDRPIQVNLSSSSFLRFLTIGYRTAFIFGFVLDIDLWRAGLGLATGVGGPPTGTSAAAAMAAAVAATVLIGPWPAAAYSAVLHGTSGKPWRWPILSILRLGRAPKDLARIARSIRYADRCEWWENTLVLGGVLVSVAGIVAVGWAGVLLLVRLGVTSTQMFAGLIVVVGGGAIVARVVSERKWWHDRRTVARIGDGTVLDEESLRTVLGRLRTDPGIRLLVTSVRRRRIGCTRPALDLLAGLAMTAESGLLQLNLATLTQGRVRHVSDQTIDEVVRLVEETGTPSARAAALS